MFNEYISRYFLCWLVYQKYKIIMCIFILINSKFLYYWDISKKSKINSVKSIEKLLFNNDYEIGDKLMNKS